VQEFLVPLLDPTVKIELASLAALSLGLIYVGDCNGYIGTAIVQAMMDHGTQVKDTWGRFLGLGLALLYLGE
jgi:26S proteasome regulatory subunit N1